jgi:tRNA (guanine-N7-)-methyltransferase
MNQVEPPTPRLYGRRKGRPLHKRKAALIEHMLPKVLITLESDARVRPQTFFEGCSEAHAYVEIGFGGGEHLAAQAKLHPDAVFIGCEPFINGVASLLDYLDRDETSNVRIFNDDARLVLDALENASLDGCFVLFPDPWPKKRHIERRFIGPENLDRLARVLRRGAVLRIASDHPGLITWMKESLNAHDAFECIHADVEPPVDWIVTRYQQKAMQAGRQAFFMDYRRK